MISITVCLLISGVLCSVMMKGSVSSDLLILTAAISAIVLLVTAMLLSLKTGTSGWVVGWMIALILTPAVFFCVCAGSIGRI